MFLINKQKCHSEELTSTLIMYASGKNANSNKSEVFFDLDRIFNGFTHLKDPTFFCKLSTDFAWTSLLIKLINIHQDYMHEGLRCLHCKPSYKRGLFIYHQSLVAKERLQTKNHFIIPFWTYPSTFFTLT